MGIIGSLVRFLGFAFHLVLCLFLLGVSSLAWTGGQHNLQLGMLPWQGATLTHWLFFSSLAGLLLTILAMRRILPILFCLWAAAVLVMTIRGFFLSPYYFSGGMVSLNGALVLTALALVSVAGGWLQVRRASPAPAAKVRALA